MWDDAKQMNALAITLATITVVCLAWAAVAYVVRLPAFEFNEVVVATPLNRANGAQLEAVIRDELTGTFFTMDLTRARATLRNVPWVRDVGLRRQWPHRLVVTVEEFEPLARWNEGSLVSRQAEVFAAESAAELPQFEGPEGRATEVAARYAAWSEVLQPLNLTLTRVRMSARGGWQLKAKGPDGPLTIELGRDEPDARLARFVAAHGRTLAPLAKSGTRVETVDLRYRNGFAVRVPGFREKNAKPAA
ncbi:MAG: cell division protein FtsQ/DivIB [Burkholderiales bacterium]